MTDACKPPALILAAGSARRFGSDKRLYPVDGVAMLARTLRVYRTVFDDVAVVIRPGEPEIADLVRSAACAPVEASDADLGQSRSLAAGVAARADARGLVIGLGDMPYVASATLRTLIREMAHRPEYIVRPRHAGRPGNPVGFPAHTFPALRNVAGDTGARRVIASIDKVRYVDVEDAGVLTDIDRPPAPSAAP